MFVKIASIIVLLIASFIEEPCKCSDLDLGFTKVYTWNLFHPVYWKGNLSVMALSISSLSLWHNLMAQKTFMPFDNYLPLSLSLSVTCKVFEIPKEESICFEFTLENLNLNHFHFPSQHPQDFIASRTRSLWILFTHLWNVVRNTLLPNPVVLIK